MRMNIPVLMAAVAVLVQADSRNSRRSPCRPDARRAVA